MNIRNQVSNGLFWIGDTSVFIAFCAGAAVLTSFFSFGIEVDWLLIIFVVSSTLFTYNLQRRLGILRILPCFRVAKNRLMVLGLAGMVFSISSLSVVQMLLYAILGLLSFFYAHPFLPFNNKVLPLRNVPFVKFWVIVIVWILSTSALPLLPVASEIVTSGWIIYLVQQFLFIAALTIPFDIRDLQVDDPLQKTLPMLLGVKKAQQLALVLCVISFVCVGANFFLGNFSFELFSAYAVNISIAFWVLKFGPKLSRLYHLIFIDGLILLQGGLLFLLVNKN